MGQSALEMISAITPLMLGLAGICACIALAMALGRYFMYEHGNDDLQPASKRITHVFGFIAAIGFVSVGGMNLAKKWATDPTINPSINGAGSSLVPEGAAKGNSYSNIGDLIMSQTKVEEHMSTDDAQSVVNNPDATAGEVRYAGLVLNYNTEGATPEMIWASFAPGGVYSEEYKQAFINAYGEEAYNNWRNSQNQSGN